VQRSKLHRTIHRLSHFHEADGTLTPESRSVFVWILDKNLLLFVAREEIRPSDLHHGEATIAFDPFFHFDHADWTVTGTVADRDENSIGLRLNGISRVAA